ncbi:MAG: tRNA (cytidine(34)-2'-O)-methyltransferase [Wenzhouxiangellaceae bacterium]|nr:tRNA (cytidine(34)-2'-O)-methyltransferase [Wenzhouxiangellaceae bacterium]
MLEPEHSVPAIVLYQPEIPPNTGNIIRLCANTGAMLHLVGPLGFQIDDRRLRRAGLDHFDRRQLQIHDNLDQAMERLPDRRWLALTTRGATRYDRVDYAGNDVLLFGPETRGLPDSVLERLPDRQRVKIPQRPESRSLNLSNSVAIVFYEAWRQMGFI